MARHEYREYLAWVPLFAQCNKKQLEEIGRVADEVVVKAGEEFIRQGDVGREALIILDGRATVTTDGAVVATLGKGDVVGELSLLRPGHRRNASVRADTDIDALVLTASGLDQLLDDVPGLAKHLLYEVARRLSADEDVRTRS
ncbi:MAG TPA: cyclic nucleotide-binding domain-containing protein [Acidimicrobiales bacterium]|nr:cyclic nucleotide-binding domain-containing protein [Acidimicrobiales bacterium]